MIVVSNSSPLITLARIGQLDLLWQLFGMSSVGILETGFRRGLVADLRRSYQELLAQGIRIDLPILNRSLAACNLPSL